MVYQSNDYFRNAKDGAAKLLWDERIKDNPNAYADDLEVAGKRGNVTLDYQLMSSGKAAGEVSKRLMLGGLREYCPDAMAGIVEDFYRLKARGTRVGMDGADQPAGA